MSAPYVLAAFLLCAGIWGIVHQRTMIGQVVAFGVAQSSTYVLLLSIGFRHGAAAPILTSTPAGAPTVDPVVQALCLTDIVVSATTSALLLVLVGRVGEAGASIDPDQPSEARGA